MAKLDVKRLLSRERRKGGLTYYQVAEGIGCSASYIFRIEKGARKNPNYDIVQKMIDYFGLDESDLKEYIIGDSVNEPHENIQ